MTTTDSDSHKADDTSSETEEDTDTIIPHDSDTPSETVDSETETTLLTTTDSDSYNTDDISSETGADAGTKPEIEEDAGSIVTLRVPSNQCCGTLCVDCEKKGQVCDFDAEVCAPAPCLNDSDCLSEGYVCNEAWGYCVVASCEKQPNMTRCEVTVDPYSERAYDICVDEVCVSPGCGDIVCNVPGPYFPLPDTNQRSCYDDESRMICPSYGEFHGQDAQYGWDLTYKSERRFIRTKTSSPVVTDTVTGLMWQGCLAGRSGPDCLEGVEAEYNLYHAVGYCEELQWGGYMDWRLPDRYALHSISDASRINPAVDLDAFPQTTAYYTLSSSSVDLDHVWVHSDALGGMFIYEKDVPFTVRCVRGDGGKSPLRIRGTTITDDPIVEDIATGLVWQGCAAGLSGDACEEGEAIGFTWKEALAYCEQLTWGGIDEWRLPNKIELDSIVVSHSEPIGLDAAVFPNTPEDSIWSATTYADESQPGYAWGVFAASGSVHHLNIKTSAYYVLCVLKN